MIDLDTDRLRAIEIHAEWITHYCEWIKQHAGKLQKATDKLTARPEWETKARDELKISAETLHVTLCLCRSAMEAYDARPTIAKATLEAAE
jgi:hypothetical protein